MKLKTLLISLLVGGIQCISAQTYNSIITDKEIYDFLEWVVENNKKVDKNTQKKSRKISAHITPWEIGNFVFDPYSDKKYLFKKTVELGLVKLFDENDRVYMLEQFESNKSSVWHQNIAGNKLITEEDNDNINFYSIPLFSKNKDYVIIHRVFKCGEDCYSGKYYVYKSLKDGEWKYLTSIDSD